MKQFFFRAFLLFLIFSPGCGINLFAQEFDSVETDTQLEKYFEEADDEQQLEIFGEIFDELRNSPLNLNSATRNELLQIPILTNIEADAIISYRKNFGGFISIYELRNIPAISAEKAALLFDFFFVEAIGFASKEIDLWDGILSNPKLEIRSRVISDLQTRSAFLDGKYEGSKLKQYTRIKASTKNIFFSLLTDKDAGENNFADHSKFTLGVKNIGVVKKFILGSFLIENGQGLAAWSPYSTSKGGDVFQSIFRSSGGVKEFAGSLENNFFNGVAAGFEFSNLNVSLFYSNHSFDSSIDSTTDEVKSLKIDGLHRTSGELNYKNNLAAAAGGVQIGYDFSSALKINLFHLQSSFEKNFSAANNYGVKGNKMQASSFSYSGNYKNIYYSGEVGKTEDAVATINSAALYATKILGIVLSHRYYPTEYRTLYANGFSESSTSNETGIYFGLTSENEFGQFNFYSDIYAEISEDAIGGLPLAGNDFLFEWNKIFGNVQAKVRYKFKSEEEKISVDNMIQTSDKKKENLRIDLFYGYKKIISFRNRIEAAKVTGKSVEREAGFLIFHDMKIEPMENIFLQGRIIFFKTTSFASAIYEFENDIPGVMTNLPMYGEGARWYLLGKIRASNFFNIAFKYSETVKPLEKKLGGGDSEILGSLDNRFSLLIEIRF